MIAKSYSTRLPGKNRKLYNGVPMYIYTLKKMLKCEVDIFFNSDSEDMISDVKKLDSRIKTCTRPEHLMDTNLPSVPLFQYIYNYFEISDSSVLNVQANSPSIKTGLIKDAISILKYCNVSELLSIYPETRANNGSLWGFSQERLLNYGDPYLHKPTIFLEDPSVDIHTLEDFQKSVIQSNSYSKSQ